MVEAEPQCRGGRELRVATADDAAGKQAEGRDQNHAAGGKVRDHVRRAHPGHRRQWDKAAEKDQRHPIGDGHGQKIAGGGEGHQRREQHQADGVGKHDHVGVVRECTCSAAHSGESGEPELHPLQSSLRRMRADPVRLAGKS